MNLFVPELNLAFVPILKNASRSLSQALKARWPYALPAPFGRQIAVLRDPHGRMEATWRMFRGQGLEIPFSQWVIEVCSDENWPHDPHLRSQTSFFDAKQVKTLLFWDFSAFSRLFDVKIRQNPPFPPLKWSDLAKKHHHRRYRADLRLWRSQNG